MPIKDSLSHEIVWSREKSHRLWNFYSSRLPEHRYFGFHSGSYVLDYIGRYVEISSMRSVLDFGCGPGYFIRHLIKICRGKIYGLDFSEAAVDRVTKEFGNHRQFGKAIWVNRLPSSFEESSMDLVISVEVVEHLDDGQLSGMLSEIKRLLKPAGYVVVTTPNDEDLSAEKLICPECGSIFHRWQHVRSWNAQSLCACFEQYGFQTFHVAETLFGPRERLPRKLARWVICRLRSHKPDSAQTPKPHLIYIGRK